MTRYRRVEPWLVVLAVGEVWVLARRLPEALPVGSLVAGCGLALLLQGLVRDLFTLAHHMRARRRGETALAAEERACMCLESLVGLPLVLAGGALAVAFLGGEVRFTWWTWPVLAALIWGGGFLMRDLVLEWRPRWRIARVKDHGAIIVQWRARAGVACENDTGPKG